ncbi:MAG TPA: TetR/AcrR family transcriptional regulator [Spirochaetota bacterium]|nr:TetR/AcrR family transcriptional regulator [Spirochaetota bacterium]
MPTKTFSGLIKVKQDKIFKVALKEFSEKGYALASTNNICKSAGISKGSVFQYFETKEDLFFFVIRKALAEIIYSYKKDYQIDVEKMELKEIFIESCFQFIEFYEKYPFHYKLYLRINYETDIPNYREVRRYVARYVTAITHKFIEVGKKRGLLRDEISSDLTLFFINNFLSRFVEICFIPGVEPTFNVSSFSRNERMDILEEIYGFLMNGMKTASA